MTMGSDDEIRSSFANLFRETAWGPVRGRFELMSAAPAKELIGNVNIVPHVGDQWLLLQKKGGLWDIPGGTLEPGETYMDALRRELLEEAGARPIDFELFGAWWCRSSLEEPYRPHLPHPDFYRVVGHGAVEIVSAPQNPPGGEEIVSVDLFTVEEVSDRLQQQDRPELAEVYRLAAGLISGG